MIRRRIKAAIAAFKDPLKVSDGELLQNTVALLYRRQGMAIIVARRFGNDLHPEFHMLDGRTQYNFECHTGIRLP